ncbi:hypothetical protein AGIG_G23950 [Arapaima gigas]
MVAPFLPVKGSLNNQFWEFGPVSSRFHVQGEQVVVISCDLVALQPVLPRVWVMCACEWEACPWRCVLSNINVNLLGREAGRVVVDVLHLHLYHADLLVVGKHLHGKLALRILPAHGLPVNPLLGVQQSALWIHIYKMGGRVLQNPKVGFLAPFPRSNSGIFGNVPNNSARTLLLRNRIIQVFQGEGLSPKQKKK